MKQVCKIYGKTVYDLPVCSIGKPVISALSSQDITGPTARNLVITLTITGTEPTVTVYRGEQAINDPRMEARLSRTQFEFIISDLRLADAGEYRIVATNEYGTANTTITVIPEGKCFVVKSIGPS